METNLIEIFRKWFAEELDLSKVSIPTACCSSTIRTDYYPNARFVSLKGGIESNSIVTGTLTSRKGIEISNINRFISILVDRKYGFSPKYK